LLLLLLPLNLLLSLLMVLALLNYIPILVQPLQILLWGRWGCRSPLPLLQVPSPSMLGVETGTCRCPWWPVWLPHPPASIHHWWFLQSFWKCRLLSTRPNVFDEVQLPWLCIKFVRFSNRISILKMNSTLSHQLFPDPEELVTSLPMRWNPSSVWMRTRLWDGPKLTEEILNRLLLALLN
jgi:hypothetical protein